MTVERPGQGVLPALSRYCVACAVGGCVLAGITIGGPQQGPADDERPARGLDEEARRLLERGEVGEAVLVANRLGAIAPHDPRVRRLVGELQTLAAGTGPPGAPSRR